MSQITIIDGSQNCGCNTCNQASSCNNQCGNLSNNYCVEIQQGCNCSQNQCNQCQGCQTCQQRSQICCEQDSCGQQDSCCKLGGYGWFYDGPMFGHVEKCQKKEKCHKKKCNKKCH